MKTFKFLSLAFLIAFLSSCEDNSNDDFYEEAWYIKDVTVSSNDWVLVGNPGQVGSYYEYIVYDVPLKESYYSGIVAGYMYMDFDTNNEIQMPLPYTEYFVDNSSGYSENCAIQYSYDMMANGTVAFKAQPSNHNTQSFRPGKQHFRIAIIW